MFLATSSPSSVVTMATGSAGWSWEATATIIQAVATVIALAGVAITFVYSLRAERREHERTQAEAQRAREDAERSDASASRAERAAALSIDTMARIADAIEKLAAGSNAASVLPAPVPKRVRWSLNPVDGGGYELTNTGTATARAVRLSADPTLSIADGFPDEHDMHPDASETFTAHPTPSTRDRTITVEWSDEEGPDAEREVWRYPLPPRPPEGENRR